MRIISQDGTNDIEYEKNNISIIDLSSYEYEYEDEYEDEDEAEYEDDVKKPIAHHEPKYTIHGGNVRLGNYSSLERTKKVLEEIRYFYCEMRFQERQGKYVKEYFEMPKDKETTWEEK